MQTVRSRSDDPERPYSMQKYVFNLTGTRTTAHCHSYSLRSSPSPPATAAVHSNMPAVLLVLFFLPQLPLSSSVNFTFPSFDQAAPGAIAFQGNASLVGGVINLTSPSQSAAGASSGRAVLAAAVPVWDPHSGAVTDFTSSFSFVLGDASADGFAFFLAPYPSAPPSAGGGYAALFDGTTVATIQPDHIIAIEVDQLGNDISSGNGATDINNFSVTTVTQNSSFPAGVVGTAKIQYDSGSKKLNVSVYYPAKTVSVSHIVNLQEALPSDVAVGFSTTVRGASAAPHRILSWNFSSTLIPHKSSEGANSGNGNSNPVAMEAGVVVGVAAFAVSVTLAAFFLLRRRRRQGGDDDDVSIDDTTGPRRFSYAELVTATRNFADDRRLGEGGFGGVYRGVLATNPPTEIAVKRVSKNSKQGKREYIAEVTIISLLRHRNLVQLLGYCHDKGKLLLVYEFMPNGSLDAHLHGERPGLVWHQRYHIVAGLASGLLYLHEECEKGVIHRDIKPSNVMLDAEFTPKLGDFGLATLIEHDVGALTTRLVGTRGYMAPEYLTTGKARKESDIYSFGVVTLEVVTGRSPRRVERDNDECVDLVGWVWDRYGQGKPLAAAADVGFDADDDEVLVERMVTVGLWCAHPDFEQRPSIRQVVNVLNFDANPPELPSRKPVPVFQPPPEDAFSLQDVDPADSGADLTASVLLGR